MNKNLVFLLLFIAQLLSCTSNNKDQEQVNQQLQRWDSIVYDHPAVVLDSLNTINMSALSDGNTAYLSLLITIANEKVGNRVENDTLISKSLAWYKESKDYYNLCRTLFYKGIVLYNINYTDSLSYYPIKEAEELYINKNIGDKYLGSRIYFYLGRMNRFRSNPVLAESYLKKSIDLSSSINNIEDTQLAKLELFWVCLSKKRYSEALSNIISFGDSGTLSPKVAYSLYNALSSYYIAKKDYNISIEYIKKILKIKGADNVIINYPKLYYSLATYYKREGIHDSVLLYSKLAVKSIRDSSGTETHFYYKYLAEVYLAKGDYKNAAENYKKGYFSYISVFSKIYRNRVQEMEKRYDLSHKEDQLSKAKLNGVYLLYIVFALIIFIILILIVLRLIIKSYNAKVESAEKKLSSIDAELKRVWLICEVQKVSTGLLPLFLEEIGKEAARSRKVSKEMFDNLNHSIDNVRTQSRNKITTIAKKETFGSLNPRLELFTELSDFEKIILVLIDYNYSVQEIAELLNTTPPSIRSIKTKIKEKILATEGLPFDPSTTFSIFK